MIHSVFPAKVLHNMPWQLVIICVFISKRNTFQLFFLVPFAYSVKPLELYRIMSWSCLTFIYFWKLNLKKSEIQDFKIFWVKTLPMYWHRCSYMTFLFEHKIQDFKWTHSYWVETRWEGNSDWLVWSRAYLYITSMEVS